MPTWKEVATGLPALAVAGGLRWSSGGHRGALLRRDRGPPGRAEWTPARRCRAAPCTYRETIHGDRAGGRVKEDPSGLCKPLAAVLDDDVNISSGKADVATALLLSPQKTKRASSRPSRFPARVPPLHHGRRAASHRPDNLADPGSCGDLAPTSASLAATNTGDSTDKKMAAAAVRTETDASATGR